MPGSPSLDELQQRLREELRLRFAQGQRPRVEELLTGCPELSHSPAHLLELIRTEYTLRAQAGEPLTREELARRFPDWSEAEWDQFAGVETAVGGSSADLYRTVAVTAQTPTGGSTSTASGDSSLGNYILVREIGRGAMGIVYEAEHRLDGRRVALKTLPQDRAASLLRFKSEFRALCDVTHDNLVRMLDLYIGSSQAFFTMELVDGVSFLEYVRSGFDSAEARSAHRFDEQRLRQGLLQLANGVQALHDAGILHRDLKPSNVLVRSDDQRVVILDFGLAVHLPTTMSGSNAYKTRHVAGTPRYMAPEQWQGEVYPSSDWYAVGVMLFEALTGTLPSSTAAAGQPAVTDPRTHNPDVPADLAALCMGLLRTAPGQRLTGHDVLRRLSAEEFERPAKGTWVGRRDELERLFQAAARVGEGRALAVFIEGPSGIGKTALVNHFLHLLCQQRPTLVFRGRCYEGEFVSYNAFDGAVDGLAAYLARLTEDRAERLLPTATIDLCRVFPVFSEVQVCQKFPLGLAPQGSAQEARQRGFAALRELLERLARFESALVVLFLDDLQRCDQDSADLFNELMRLPQAPPILVLATLRNDEGAAASAVAGILKFGLAERARKDFADQWNIQVGALSREEIAQLARDQGQAPRAEEIARESGGIPIFIDYLLESERAGNVFHDGDSRSLSLAAELSGRLQRQPAHARRLVQLVAIAGRPVDVRVLTQAVGGDATDAVMLSDLRRQRMVRTMTGPDGAVCIDTYHDRVREVAKQQVSQSEAAALCSALAAAVEANLPHEAEWLAELFARGGEMAKAGEYSIRAARQAQDKLAFGKAAAMYRRALQWLVLPPAEEGVLRENLAEALSHSGRSREAAEEFLRASTLSRDEHATELRCRAALRYLTSGHLSEGLQTLREVLREVGLSYPATRFAALAALAQQRLGLWLRGLRLSSRREPPDPLHRLRLNVTWSAAAGLSVTAPLQAATFVSRNLRLALDAGDTHDLVRALAAQICHLSVGGGRSRRVVARYLRALHRVSAAYEIDEPLGVPPAEQAHSARRVHPYAKATRAMARGIAAHLRGEWESARENCDRAANYLLDPACRDVTWELDTARTFSLWCLMYMGEVGELGRRQPSLLGLAQENDDLFAVLNFGTIVMTYVLLGADDATEARRRLSEDQRRLTPHGFFVPHHNWLLASTLLELYDGDGPAAWQLIEHGWQRYSASLLGHVQQVRVNFLETYGRAALAAAAAGQTPAELIARAARAAAQLRGERVAWAAALAEVLEAGAANVRQERERAIAGLARSIELLQSVSMHLYAAACQWHLGRLRGSTEGEALIRQADSRMRQLGITRPSRMARAMVTGFTQPAESG